MDFPAQKSYQIDISAGQKLRFLLASGILQRKCKPEGHATWDNIEDQSHRPSLLPLPGGIGTTQSSPY